MGTRSFVGIYDDDGGWVARYCHWDGYPRGVGKSLWDNYQKNFKGVLGAMTKILLDEKVGWSSLAASDLTLPPVWADGYKFDDHDTRAWKSTEEITQQIYAMQCELMLTDEELRILLYEFAPKSYTARGETDEQLITQVSDLGWLEWGYVFNVPDRRMDIYTVHGGYAVPAATIWLDQETEPEWEKIENEEA